MDNVLLVIFLIAALFFAGFVVQLYENIRSKKAKKVIAIIFMCILAISLIVLIAFLSRFFNLIVLAQPL